MRWKRKQSRRAAARDSYSAVHPDVSLAELHAQARPPQHWTDDPRQFSDYGELPDDYDIAAEIDAGVYDVQDDDQTARFRAMVQDEDRTPRETWKRWRAYGRRHGTEHPEQTADRIKRTRAGQAAQAARIDQSTTGRVQDRYDTRTSGNVSANAMSSRRLNASHVDRPPVSSPVFDFQAEQINGGPYRSGRPSGQRGAHADYRWSMEDGFRF